MFLAAKIGNITGEFPVLYKDELLAYVDKYKYIEKELLTGDYFIPAENVSLKSGYFGIKIYSKIDELIISIITCRQGHTPLDAVVSSQLKLYLLRWKN